MQTIDVDGALVDADKAADAVRRCVKVMIAMNNFNRVYAPARQTDTPLLEFLTEIETILKGEDIA